jgi:hypothetical protein
MKLLPNYLLTSLNLAEVLPIFPFFRAFQLRRLPALVLCSFSFLLQSELASDAISIPEPIQQDLDFLAVRSLCVTQRVSVVTAFRRLVV